MFIGRRRTRRSIVFATWLALASLVLAAAPATAWNAPAQKAPLRRTRAGLLGPITNNSRPNEVDTHFGGKPLAKIRASTIGYSEGTCLIYSNKSSWAVYRCVPGGNATSSARRSHSLDPQSSADSTSRTRARLLSPITNSSWPNEVDKHFAGKPLAKIPASTIGYPDGTCWLYSDMSSWAVIECLGGINIG